MTTEVKDTKIETQVESLKRMPTASLFAIIDMENLPVTKNVRKKHDELASEIVAARMGQLQKDGKPVDLVVNPELVSDAKPDVSNVKSDVAELLAISNRAQQARRSVPLSSQGGKVTIPQKELIRRYAAKFGGQNNPKGYHFWFGDGKELRNYAYQGHQPVIDGGDIVRETQGGDVLLMTPTDIYNDTIRHNEQVSDRITRAEPEERLHNAAFEKSEQTMSRPGDEGHADRIAEFRKAIEKGAG